MKDNQSRSDFDLLIKVLSLAFGLFALFVIFCHAEYRRNLLSAYTTLTFYDTWDEAEAARKRELETPGHRPSEYFYCPKHQPPSDPQLLAMQAAVYGWKEVPCPYCLASTAAIPAAKK